MKLLSATILITALLISAGCDQLETSSSFSLPPGDLENGKLLFSSYKCIECHTLAGTEFLGEEARLTEDGGIAVELGGVTDTPKTYAELVTSVINPSHRIAEGYLLEQVVDQEGESKMVYYNSIMTVEELVDIVTYLESLYELEEITETYYPHYQHF